MNSLNVDQPVRDETAVVSSDKPAGATICWKCDNACGGCSWSREFKPVPGWKATRNDVSTSRCVSGKNRRTKTESYIVHECPEFVPDPPLEERKKRWIRSI